MVEPLLEKADMFEPHLQSQGRAGGSPVTDVSCAGDNGTCSSEDRMTSSFLRPGRERRRPQAAAAPAQVVVVFVWLALVECRTK